MLKMTSKRNATRHNNCRMQTKNGEFFCCLICNVKWQLNELKFVREEREQASLKEDVDDVRKANATVFDSL